jgi:dihydroflavonol-4-reductase
MNQHECSSTVLVTGATGYTGGKLALHLAGKGYRVRALARPGADVTQLTAHGIEIIQGDLTCAADVDRAVAGVEKIYHIAACFRTAGHADSYYHAVNVQGTQHVLDAAKKHDCERVVHCSTIGVHGSVKQIPSDETAPFDPGDIYQRTKLEGEKLAVAAQQQGQPVAIFRPAGIYGPGELRFMKLFKTITRRTFRMFGPGTTNLHLVYIDDLVAGIQLCGNQTESLGEVFILCGPDYVCLNDAVRIVADVVGVRPPRGHLPLGPLLAAARLCELVCVPLGIDPPLHTRRAEFFTKNRAFTCAKATRVLGYQPQIDSAEGLKRTGAWYMEQGHI